MRSVRKESVPNRRKERFTAICSPRRTERKAQHDNAIDPLDAEHRQMLEKFKMDLFHQTAIEQQELYKHGYHDCIAFLKRLNLINGGDHHGE